MLEGNEQQWRVPLTSQPVIDVRIRIEISEVETHGVHLMVQCFEMFDVVRLDRSLQWRVERQLQEIAQARYMSLEFEFRKALGVKLLRA